MYYLFSRCKEKTYQSSKFHNRVAHYPISKDTPPKLELIEAFCDDVTDWLAESEENVAVVHAFGNKVGFMNMDEGPINLVTAIEFIKGFCDDVTDRLAKSEKNVAIVHAHGNR